MRYLASALAMALVTKYVWSKVIINFEIFTCWNNLTRSAECFWIFLVGTDRQIFCRLCWWIWRLDLYLLPERHSDTWGQSWSGLCCRTSNIFLDNISRSCNWEKNVFDFLFKSLPWEKTLELQVDIFQLKVQVQVCHLYRVTSQIMSSYIFPLFTWTLSPLAPSLIFAVIYTLSADSLNMERFW